MSLYCERLQKYNVRAWMRSADDIACFREKAGIESFAAMGHSRGGAVFSNGRRQSLAADPSVGWKDLARPDAPAKATVGISHADGTACAARGCGHHEVTVLPMAFMNARALAHCSATVEW